MNCKEIIKKYLVDHGFDGLYYISNYDYADNCECLLNDFMHCGGYLLISDCKPGYASKNEDGETIIGPKRLNDKKETIGKEKILTLQKLKDMKCGVFARGEVFDDFGLSIKWVATRGMGINDWAIYCHSSCDGVDYQYVRNYGNKCLEEKTIKKLVPCDDEAFKMYRFK